MTEIAPPDADRVAPERSGASPAPADAHTLTAAAGSAAYDVPSRSLDRATIHAIVAGIMLAMFLSALEQTIVAPALPAIGASLGGVDDLSWVVTAYLLAATATTPL